MSWDRDPLWAKARLYLEHAFEASSDDPRFGLWSSLGLEFLGRAALASISPTLLAEPDREHKFLLHALNRGSEKVPRRSIRAHQVFALCQTLFKEFTEDDLKAALALVSRRNDELHSGNSAFDEYPSRQWVVPFYRVCRSLTSAMGESLETLLGQEAAEAATKMLDESQKEVKHQVQRAIADSRKKVAQMSEPERKTAMEYAEKQAAILAYKRHHRVNCPACGSVATIQGETFGSDKVINEETSIKVLQTVLPNSFSCPVCELKFKSYAELDAAGLGGHYVRTSIYSPEEYYGLIDPDSIDPSEFVEQYLKDLAADQEYDNE